MRSEHDFDQQIKAALKEELDHTKPPLRADQAWDYIQTKRQLQKINKRKKTAGVFMAAAILLFVLSVTFPKQGSAFFNITTVFHKVQDSVVQLFAGNEVELSTTDDPIIEREEPNITLSNRGEMQEFSSVEEMFTATGFEVIEPSYIPQSFELVSLQVYTEEKVGAVETFLHYELNEKYFIITQIMQSDQLGFNGSVQSEEEKIEEVDVNGMTGSLVEASQEDYILVWFSPTHFLSVEGNIVAEEIVKIARSMNMDE